MPADSKFAAGGEADAQRNPLHVANIVLDGNFRYIRDLMISKRSVALYLAVAFFVVLNSAFAQGPVPPATGVSNFSARSHITPEKPAIIGFVISGKEHNILIRAVGPALARLGVSDAAADPRLVVLKGDEIVASNEDWAKPEQPEPPPGNAWTEWSFRWVFSQMYLRMQYVKVGAADLGDLSKDAALMLRLPPGVYTAVAYSNSGSGDVLLEGYLLPDVL